MKHFKLIAAAALTAATAACVNTSSDYSQPYYGSTTSYPSGYAPNYPTNYYGQQTPYVTTQSNRRYRDRNHDGIPDARQQRWP